MSNYCGNCHYSHTKKTGSDACPFNALYWNFLNDKKEHFKQNNRMNMMMSLLDKMDNDKLAELQKRATSIIENLDAY
jgi:deoxyribodipyrimidine photolyase-related protein